MVHKSTFSRQVISLPILLPHLLFYILSTRFLAKPAFGFTNETDREALLAIKDRISYDSLQGSLSSWNDSIHFCNWNGVTCGLRHQRVTILNLSSLNLAGSLSPHVGNLTFLKEINLQENNFHGTIPQEIGGLFRLQFLRLANNSFQGGIPINLTRCSDMQVIDLRGNQLEGSVPPELGTLSKLYELSLSTNNLSGNIPSSLGNLSALRVLGLGRNGFRGSIPVELGHLSNLYRFSLTENKLSGIIPAQIYNISSIQIFSVTDNLLSGNFPSNLGLTLPKLQSFVAALNRFSGSIPASLANASGLVQISIGRNALVGLIPLNLGALHDLQVLSIAPNPLDQANDISVLITSLTNCTNLNILALSSIQIGGELPNSIGNLSSKLAIVTLYENYIYGGIPQGILELTGLTYLSIHTNLLTGSIPDSIGRLANLQEFYLYTNNISGKITPSFGNITGLSILNLRDNMLQGSIPASLGDCSELRGLDLGRNRLTGTIPEEIFGLTSLSLGLFLFENYLTGSLPSQVGNLVNMVSLVILENKLSGEIPSTLGNCLMLTKLQMGGNSFEGGFPSQLEKLKSIEVLDISRNNLSGQIPKFLGEFRFLTNLNLSFNKFEGEVPSGGVFINISLFSVLGNSDLCGGAEQLKLPPCPTEGKKKKPSVRLVIWLPISVVLPIILMVVFLCAILYRKKSKQPPSSTSKEENQYPKLSYAELLESTNGFASSNLIGQGKYGSVYKGILNTDQTVAVKVLNLQETGADKSFLAECEALRKLRHRNLVKIITSCSSLDFKGNDFKALVFEFMPNGSLERWLYPDSSRRGDAHNLSLSQRLTVAIDVASALTYLRHHYDVPIAHCDLKPSNVLLDCDLCARVGDFGLTRFLSAAAGKSSLAQSSSIGIRGTVGYVAPEYGMGGDISTQGDLYSYGILLLEMFTGKKPTNNMFTDNLNLHSYAKMALPRRVMEIIDHEIIMEEEEEEEFGGTSESTKGNVVKECLASILQIGVSCSAEEPRGRMDIRDALVELHRIRNLVFQIPTGSQGGRRERGHI